MPDVHAGARIEVLIRITGKIAKSLHFILHGMRVNNIHNDGNSHSMRRINQFLQFIRCTETG